MPYSDYEKTKENARQNYYKNKEKKKKQATEYYYLNHEKRKLQKKNGPIKIKKNLKNIARYIVGYIKHVKQKKKRLDGHCTML